MGNFYFLPTGSARSNIEGPTKKHPDQVALVIHRTPNIRERIGFS
jgi:hypothetical protein